MVIKSGQHEKRCSSGSAHRYRIQYSLVCSRWWGDQVAKYRRSKYAINLQKIEPDFKRCLVPLSRSLDWVLPAYLALDGLALFPFADSEHKK